MEKSKIKVIVLSTDPKVRLQFRKIAAQSNEWVVFTDSRGDTGKRKILEQEPHLIFLSPFLIGKGGIRLCEELRGTDGFRHAPIIGLLKQKGEEHIGRISEAGFDSFLTFPVQKEELIKVCHSYRNIHNYITKSPIPRRPQKSRNVLNF